MDYSRVIFFLGEGLEDHVGPLRLIVFDQIKVDVLCLHEERVGSLANLALEGPPKVGREVWRHLRLPPNVQPRAKAVKVDLADGTRAFARTQEWVLRGSLTSPAESTPATTFLTFFLSLVKNSRHCRKLIELFVQGRREGRVRAVAFLILFLLGNLHGFVFFTVPDFLHCELDSANLQNVPFFDFIVLKAQKSFWLTTFDV